MIYLLCKNILHGRHIVRASITYERLFVRNPSSIFLKFISNGAGANHYSFAVSYLINSCGFSPESALRASKYLHFETPGKPDSVIAFLKNHCLSETQISTVIKKLPDVLTANPEKTLLPKLDFFYSKGFSSAEIAKVITSQPFILRRSIENQLNPCFNFFKNMLKSEKKTVEAIKRGPGILRLDLKRTPIVRNINLLRESGVPESIILDQLRRQPLTFLTNPDRFRDMVEEVKGLGFNPLMSKFVLAVYALRTMTKSTWEMKVDVYKKWGWSDEDIILAFSRNPWCMMTSENKIMAVMDYIVNIMGLESLFICRSPVILSFSMEKRIVPRGSVAQILLLKGLIKERNLSRLFSYPENLFLEKFVKCYEEEAPELLKLYTEKLGLSKKLGSVGLNNT
ncbi:hypothetical protein HS088_TW01G00123 [Tripterygium wilfordii]|uniref:Mitochondrial transcription termination factor family protein n=1 Tax=Tripterygium wilfordii TaxID=458696 RepID=A0A7J7E0S4_TRIWF|nr:uncharacterized protein LOC120002213 [Tripterygium wilfordii]KAF5752215.1 hypothetical protein HS088_TW01G00123 [Tripterygium wilfordii]